MESLKVIVIVGLFTSAYCGSIQQKLSKRQAREWMTKDDSDLCPNEPETQYDAMGRRQSGLLLQPQNQGRCGSCWAFAASHTFADQISLNSNRRVNAFSNDHLTKCSDGSRDDNGCCGNSLDAVTMYLNTAGAYLDSCYPYTLVNYRVPKNKDAKITFKAMNPLTCPTASCNSPLQRLQGYNSINSNQIDQIIEALKSGPVLAALLVVADYNVSLFNYACGIYTDPDPISNGCGHAVEIVDYSSPSYDGTPFFVVKNSWGVKKGERGYFRIAQNSRLFLNNIYFYSYSVDTNDIAEPPTSASHITNAVCSADEIDFNQNPLVNTAITFGLQELKKLVMCGKNGMVPTFQLVSITNSTGQVVEGMIIDVSLQVKAKECGNSLAMVRLIVLQDMNGNLTLLDYSYNAAVRHAVQISLFFFLAVLASYVNIL